MYLYHVPFLRYHLIPPILGDCTRKVMPAAILHLKKLLVIGKIRLTTQNLRGL